MTEQRIQELLAEIDRRKSESREDNLAYNLTDEHRWDWRRFSESSDTDGILQRFADEDIEWPRFTREIMALLQHGGNVNELEEPKQWAARCHGLAQSLPEFSVLQDLCFGERYDAGRAALCIAKEVLREWQLQPHDEPQDGDSSGDGNEWQTTPGGRQEPGESETRQAIREAVRKAAIETQETQEGISALCHGLNGGGIAKTDPEQRERLAKAIRDNPVLRRVAIEMGRLLRIAAAKRKADVLAAPCEITNVTVDQDLARTLPSELALLGSPAARLEFYRRFVERQTLVYEVSRKDTAERGPMVICLDVSGSMHGDKMSYAAASALALAHTALRENRPSIVFPFDTKVYEPTEFTRAIAIESTISLATIEARGGGTNWMPALYSALHFIDAGNVRDRNGKWKQADVALITDGICQVDSKWAADFNHWKHRIGVACYSLLIADIQIGISNLKPFSDKIYQIRDIQDKDQTRVAGEMIADVRGS